MKPIGLSKAGIRSRWTRTLDPKLDRAQEMPSIWGHYFHPLLTNPRLIAHGLIKGDFPTDIIHARTLTTMGLIMNSNVRERGNSFPTR